MIKFIVLVLLLGATSCVCAEEIKIKKSNLVFPVSAQNIAELAAANIKLYERYQGDVKRFGPVSFQSAYVASIIAQGGLKYIFVGFPMEKSKGTYMSVIQYCDKSGAYEFVQYGLDIGDVEKIYKQFMDTNNKLATQLDDACD